jgi:hypothetical protein
METLLVMLNFDQTHIHDQKDSLYQEGVDATDLSPYALRQKVRSFYQG